MDGIEMRQLFARRFQLLLIGMLTLGMTGMAMAQSIMITAPSDATSAQGVAAGSDVIFTVSGLGPSIPVTISKPAGVDYRANSASSGWTCTGTGSGDLYKFSGS